MWACTAGLDIAVGHSELEVGVAGCAGNVVNPGNNAGVVQV